MLTEERTVAVPDIRSALEDVQGQVGDALALIDDVRHVPEAAGVAVVELAAALGKVLDALFGAAD